VGCTYPYRRLRRLKSAISSMSHSSQLRHHKQQLYRSVYEHVHRPIGVWLYMDNVWLWTADHGIEDASLTQITIYILAGVCILLPRRGISGWWAQPVEHHSLYQYQFASTKNIFAGQVQTETAYYQPNPSALQPFLPISSWNDPDFSRRIMA
jgi:hypothetical protein